jgi:hypothetical protein
MVRSKFGRGGNSTAAVHISTSDNRALCANDSSGNQFQLRGNLDYDANTQQGQHVSFGKSKLSPHSQPQYSLVGPHEVLNCPAQNQRVLRLRMRRKLRFSKRNMLRILFNGRGAHQYLSLVGPHEVLNCPAQNVYDSCA